MGVSYRSKIQRYWGLSTVGLVGLSVILVCGPRRVPGSYADDGSSTKTTGRRATGGMPAQVMPSVGSDDFRGREIKVGHVEGATGDYLPSMQSARFAGVRLAARSGHSKVNSHTHSTASTIYGRVGLAPGIRDVHFYTASHWMGAAVLRAGSNQPPTTDGRILFTHSWIGSFGPFAIDVLRRADYVIDTYDTIMVVGVNNGRDSPVPPLLASAYNVIAVGKANGESSGGYTVFEGQGRCKPDVVADRSTTSAATPVVTATVARLLEAASTIADGTVATRAEVIKAVLMAGAQKPSDWRCEPGKPLDEHLGAGIVRFDQSCAILRRGPWDRAQTADGNSWDFQSMGPGARRVYRLRVSKVISDVSIVLVWHRHIEGGLGQDLLSGAPKWMDRPCVADFNLRVARRDQNGRRNIVGQSESSVDNIEHIYVKTLSAGHYDLEVSRHDHANQDWDYAIAWYMGAALSETR